MLDRISHGLTNLYVYTYESTKGYLESSTSSDSIKNEFTYNGQLLIGDVSSQSSGSVQISKLEKTFDQNFWATTLNISGSSGSTPVVVSYTFDQDGMVTSTGEASYTYGVLEPSLMRIALGDTIEDYSYNRFGEVSRRRVLLSNQVVYQEDFVRDHLGRIIEMTQSDGSTSHNFEYTYDLSGRLVEVKKDSSTLSEYVYDDNNNRVGGNVSGIPTVATYDNQDRLLTYNGWGYTYNDNGELTEKTLTGLGLTTTYEYDQLGALKKVTLPNSDEIEYLVDGLGRRVARKKNGVLTHRYIYDGQLQIIGDLDLSTGEVLSVYTYVSQSHSPDYMIRGGETYKFVKDISEEA